MGSSNGEQQHGHQHHQHHHQLHQQHQLDDKKQTYNLCWNEFPSNLLSFFKELREQEEFVDVTLACEGQQVSAHKVVLSACSPYFRSLLKNNPCDHPIIILNEVGYNELVTLLQYMYHGEVQIAHDQITDFLRTAKLLQVRGLAEAAAAESRSRASSECRRENGTPTPTPKIEAPDPDEEVRPPDSPQVKRIKLCSSVGPQPPSTPSPHLSSGPSPPAPTPPIPSLPLSMANMAGMGLPSLPPMIPGASLPLSLPSTITALPPVTTAHPAMHPGRPPMHTPTHVNQQPPFPGMYHPNMQGSEDTQDTMGSDRSEERDKSRHDDEEYEHENTLEKMSGLANMAALKGFGGFAGPSGLAGLASAALGSNSDSNPGCTGSRDLDLSVLMSQLGGVDAPAPLQQGLQISPAGSNNSSTGGSAGGGLQLWQHPQQMQQQQDPQQQQIRPWCEACGRSYSTVGNLKQHVANVHGRGEWVLCGVCGKTFKTRQYLQSHLLQQHGIRQRPTPALPGPNGQANGQQVSGQGQQYNDPALQSLLSNEAPSSSAHTPPYNPGQRTATYHQQPSTPAQPQSSAQIVNNNNNYGQVTEYVNSSMNGHIQPMSHYQTSAHAPTPAHTPAPTSTYQQQQQPRQTSMGPALPQPDSSGQAASPPPQQVKQERFSGFHNTHIKQEISSDHYYTI